MRRIRLILDEKLLEEAQRVLGAETPAAAVSIALAEVLQVRRVLNLSRFFGGQLCHGDLSKMREDERCCEPATKRTRR